MERYIPVALTQPKPPRIWLLFLEALGLVSGMKKSGTGDSNFVKWKGTFRSDRPKWADRSKWTTCKGAKVVPNIPVGPNRNRSIWFLTEISGILGWMKSALSGRFPFNQNFRKIGNSGKWYRNFQGKVSINSGNCWIPEMRTIQPKILKIPGVKWDGKKTSREKFFENLAIPREVDPLLGNFGKCCSIRYWKLWNIQSWRFGWRESAQKVHENKPSLSSCASKFAPCLGNCLFWFAVQNVSWSGTAQDW